MQKLSQRLKMGTKPAHSRAETTQFVTQFIKGNIDEESYAIYVSQLYYIYEALEVKCESFKDDDIFSYVYFPELYRLKALKSDLQYYYGYEWEANISELKSTEKYVKRIKNSSSHDMIAHVYTRYLGDLSGGQILKKKAQRHFLLPEGGAGVQFYEFDLPCSEQEFKKRFRAKLNEIPLSLESQNNVVKEAIASFDFNTDIFLELDAKIGLTDRRKQGKNSSDGGCPFGFVADDRNKNHSPPWYMNHMTICLIAVIICVIWGIS